MLEYTPARGGRTTCVPTPHSPPDTCCHNYQHTRTQLEIPSERYSNILDRHSRPAASLCMCTNIWVGASKIFGTLNENSLSIVDTSFAPSGVKQVSTIERCLLFTAHSTQTMTHYLPETQPAALPVPYPWGWEGGLYLEVLPSPPSLVVRSGWGGRN